MYTKTFKPAQRSWAAATALSLALALPGVVQAGSTAYSTLQLTNGMFVNGITLDAMGNPVGIGSQVTVGTDITINSFLSVVTEEATRTFGPGSPYSGSDGAFDINFNNGIDFSDPTQLGFLPPNPAPLDPCGGSGGTPTCATIGQDNFSQQALGTGEFVRAAVEKIGTGVGNTGPVAGAGGLLTDKALSEVVSQKSSLSGAETTATSSVGFNFTVNQPGVQLGFTATLFAFLESILDPLASIGNANSSAEFFFEITEGANSTPVLIDVYAPVAAALQQNVSIGFGSLATLPGNIAQSGTGGLAPLLFQTSAMLTPGNNYDVQFIVKTDASLFQVVPEPAPLGLLGLGLVAAVCMRRRQQAKG